MTKRAHRTLLALLVALCSVATGAPTVARAAIGSALCTASGSCVIATTTGLPTRSFTVKVTCKALETVFAGVRGYYSNGNYNTAPMKRFECVPGQTLSAPFTVMAGSPFVGFRATMGNPLIPHLGGYTGAPVPPGGLETSPPVVGFHWE